MAIVSGDLPRIAPCAPLQQYASPLTRLFSTCVRPDGR